MSSQSSVDGPKKATGYTYWKREIPDAHLLPSAEPQKIHHSESEESIANTRTSSGGLVSAWNQGTTYEERDITQRAKKILGDLVCEGDIDGNDLELKTLTGEIHAIHVRGKVRIGYEIHKLKLSTSKDTSIEIDDIDSTDPECFIIQNGADLGREKVKEFVSKLMTDLCAKLLTENE